VNLNGGTAFFAATPPRNTVVTIANLARVTINAQSNAGGVAQECLLDIILTTAAYGLPVGAEIQLGVATAFVS